jgi:uncharacterized membrane protein
MKAFIRRARSNQIGGLALAALVGSAGSAWGQSSFQGLGDLPGGLNRSFAAAVSADGTAVGGVSYSDLGQESFRWTSGGGIQGLGRPSGVTGAVTSGVFGVSADGATIVGFALDDSSVQLATRWTASGYELLPRLPADPQAPVAQCVALDGTAYGAGSVGAIWPAGGGVAAFPLSNGFEKAFPSACVADGSVVAGSGQVPDGLGGFLSRSFRWTSAAGMVNLGSGPAGSSGPVATCMSADGGTVAGSVSFPNTTSQAFRWTAGGGLVMVPAPAGVTISLARGISGDGSVMVGSNFGPAAGTYAAIWDSANGWRDLKQVLTTQYGLNLTGWQLSGATGISADGKTIVGDGLNPQGQNEGWIARLGQACYPNCDGSTAAPILNINDFICFQAKFAAGDPYANCDASTSVPVLNINDFICFQARFAGGCR